MTSTMESRRLILPLLMSIMILANTAANAEALVSGRVVSTSGTPLEGVWIQQIGRSLGSRTKADGLFNLPLGKPAEFLFVRDDLRPEIILTAGTEKDGEVKVVMQFESHGARLAWCKPQAHSLLPELHLRKTPYVHVRRVPDAEFAVYMAIYTKTSEVLGSRTGIHAGGLSPESDWADGLSSLSIRSIQCGGVQWIDLRGVSRHGLQSRWVGWGASLVEYSKVSRQAAMAFDSAIDYGCCR